MSKKALCIPKSIFVTVLDYYQSTIPNEIEKQIVEDLVYHLYESMDGGKDKEKEYTGKVWLIRDNAKLLRNMNMQCTLEDRDLVENDPTQFQIIPYVTFGCFYSNPPMPLYRESWGNYVLKYVRGSKGDENRLKAKHSIGFGGHIEELPVAPGNFHLIKVILDAACREVEEELGLQVTDTIKNHIFDQLIYRSSFIIEDSPVGHVHLGIHINIDLQQICINLTGHERDVLNEFLDSIPQEGSDASVDKEIDIVTGITRIPLTAMTAFEYNWEGWSQEILHDAMWDERVVCS